MKNPSIFFLNIPLLSLLFKRPSTPTPGFLPHAIFLYEWVSLPFIVGLIILSRLCYYRQLIVFMVSILTLESALLDISEKQASIDLRSAQMTIFYAGQVLVVDNLPAANAKEVMQLASKYNNVNKMAENCCRNSKPSASSSIQAKENQTQTQPLDSGNFYWSPRTMYYMFGIV